MRRMSRALSMATLASVVTLGLLLVSPAAADDGAASVDTESTRVLFTPLQVDKGISLKISGPHGFYFQRSYGPGARPSLSLIEKGGLPLEEGLYTYELKPQLEITDEIRKALRAARYGGDDTLLRRLQEAGKLPTQILVQTGSFRVAGGVVVDVSTPEQAPKDIVEYDDLMIVGSTCVGFDCVEGELFGDDTLRLKENTLRLHFDDTTTTEYFPVNDWRIIINDNYAGGAEYFAIEDATAATVPFQIKAGAPTGSLFLDETGRLGLGTSVPVTDLHLVDGDTPTISLDQDDTGGFVAQRWDLSGNENGFSITDTTSGPVSPFQIETNAPDSMLTITASGKVGIDSPDPVGKFEVKDANGTGLIDTLFRLDNDGGVRFFLNDSLTGVEWAFQNAEGNFHITKAGTFVREFLLDGLGNLSILGTLTTGSDAIYPDYVFETGYELMPLAELRTYIDENGHLPNFPAGQEVMENGLNVTETQIKLIEKVEELTLYTLGLQETIEQLRSQVSTLEQALAEQK